MIYIYRVRRFVQIVMRETRNPSFPLNERGGPPNLRICTEEFRKLSKRYTEEVANEVIAIATGRDYVGIVEDDPKGFGQGLVVKYAGVELLKPFGFLNAIASPAVAQILAVIAIIVSIAAFIRTFFD